MKRHINSFTISFILSFACTSIAPALAHEATQVPKIDQQNYQLDRVPERVVAIHQSAIENMLRLELQDKLIGVTYMDDALPADLAPRLEGVPMLAKTLPSREQLLTLQPDFLYAGFPSAFSPTNLGKPQWWQEKGTNVYVNKYFSAPSTGPLTWSDAWQDLHQLAALFQVPERAIALEQQAKAQLAALTQSSPVSAMPKPKVLLIDAYSLQANVAACCGGTDLLIRLAGGENVTEDIDGRWASLSWEAVAEANPDIILIASYQQGPTDGVIEKLNRHPLLSRMNAVKNQRILALPFTETLATPRMIHGVEKLHKMIGELR